jgi:hypothetical protein
MEFLSQYLYNMILIDCLIYSVGGGLWSSCSMEVMLKVTFWHVTAEGYV